MANMKTNLMSAARQKARRTCGAQNQAAVGDETRCILFSGHAGAHDDNRQTWARWTYRDDAEAAKHYQCRDCADVEEGAF